jgi:DNA-directed RNA polymerase subunit M/transcription elongation factor TFIIS
MKIDCPHCGVHGSVDESLTGRKLRCPQCSKIFLVTEDILPEDHGPIVVHQEILSEDPPPHSDILAEDQVDVAEEDPPEHEDLQQCSSCKQSFASLFLVEVDSKLYCTLCQPDVSDDESEFSMESGSSEESDENIPEILEDDYGNDDVIDHESDILGFMEDDSEQSSDAPTELELCAGCGESLHPNFLEDIGEKRFCALCAPEEEERGPVADEDFADNDGGDDPLAMQSSEESQDDGVDDGYLKEACCVCGEKFHLDFMQEIDSQLYCGVCQPEVVEELEEGTSPETEVVEELEQEASLETDEYEVDSAAAAVAYESGSDFSVGELLKEAWRKTKGAKGAVWGGVIVMYLLIIGLSFGGIMGSQQFYQGTDPMVAIIVNGVVQLIATWVSILMTAGVMLIGVRRAKEQRVSWRMAFSGFSRAFAITMAIILQCVMVAIGFALLVIPGIYLAVGYALALPLILDKGLGPWAALEASRKAIHKKWWTVLGLYLLMLLVYFVSAIPLGLGLIWTVPMFFVLIGVLYVRLFGADDVEEISVESVEVASEEDLEELAELEDIEDVEESEEFSEIKTEDFLEDSGEVPQSKE